MHRLPILLLVFGALFISHTLFAQSDILKVYNIPTTSNEPGIPLNSKIIVSSLVATENGNFIVYKIRNKDLVEQTQVHRLLGQPGDIVEIKKGVLFLNNINIDRELNLKHLYILSTIELQNLLKKNLIEDKDVAFQSSDNAFVFLTDEIAKDNELSSNIKLEPSGQTDKRIEKIYNNNWNIDNFGPLVIPAGKYFVIGDNRHNAEDSRFIGLIDQKDIVGTVIRK